MSLWEMTLTGGIMIIVITIIRAVFLNRLPKRTFLLLWEIAMLRLILPFSVPSVTSVYSLFTIPGSTDNAVQTAPEMDITDIPMLTDLDTEGDFPEDSDIEASEDTLRETVPPKDSVSIRTIIWLIGMLLLFAVFIAGYITVYRKYRFAEIIKGGYAEKWLSENKMRRNVKIYRSEQASSPLTYGIIHPKIILPGGIKNKGSVQLAYVLTHEITHIRRFDMLRKIAAAIILCIHWFNPLVWVLFLLYNRDIELACDEAVIRKKVGDCRSEYALTLISMKEKQKGFSSLYIHFSKNAVEERITAVMKTKKITILTAIAASVTVFGVTALFATSAAPKEDKAEAVTINEEYPDDMKKGEVIMRIYHDYSFLFKNMPDKSSSPFGAIKVSELSGKAAKKQLVSAGIDISSKQYQAVANSLRDADDGRMFTNIQGIKNRMAMYDKDGNFTAGGLIVPGMVANGIPEAERHQIISISETARQDMFDNTKREFIQENGVANGDTTKRSEVFKRYQLSEKVENRLKGTWTLGEYERAYRSALVEAVKEADPKWEPGKAFNTSVLKGITRESVENRIVQNGNKFALKPKNSLDIKA